MANIVREAIQTAIGLVFLLSSVSKLREPRAFVQGVVAYQVLPPQVAIGYGILLIPLEGFVALSLLSDRWTSFGVSIGLLLLFSFFIAVIINVRRHRDLPCNCFGSTADERVSVRSLARIGLLAAGMLIVLGGIYVSGAVPPFSWSGTGSLAKGMLRGVLACFVLVLGMWALALPDLLRLRQESSAM